MAFLFCQISGASDPLLMTKDPAGLTTVSLAAPLLVTYAGGSPAPDTVPAHTPSPDSPVDTSAATWCVYIEPGTPTLRLATEADLVTLSVTTDVAAIGRIVHHELVPFQVALSAT